jgi:hypothetical protein
MSTVTTDYNALLAAVEKQAVTSIKQAQDVSLRAAKVAVGLMPDAGAVKDFPTPQDIVEISFAFAGEVLALQKAYALELGQIVTEGAEKLGKPAGKKQQQS